MNIVAFVLAGGEGRRLGALTAAQAKPALPFAGGFRLIDFVLSNLVNSGVARIYVLAQYRPASLIDHVQRRWRGRTGARIRVLLPDEQGPFLGTADAVARQRHLIDAHAPDQVAVFAADHVYRMDVRQMAAYHRARGADVTVAAVPVPIEQGREFGIVGVDGHGRVRVFEEKPAQPTPMKDDPDRAYASMGNYLFEACALGELLRLTAARDETDFGHHVLPRAVLSHATYAYDFAGNRVAGRLPCEEAAYWRDVGTPAALQAARRDVAGTAPRFRLWNPEWPLLPAHGGPGDAVRMPVDSRLRTPEPITAAAAAWRAPGLAAARGGARGPDRARLAHPAGARLRCVRSER